MTMRFLFRRGAVVWLVLCRTRGLAPRGGAGFRRVKHFINLTNGLEALEALRDVDDVNFVRIQSSHCEACDFYGILWNLDHNLLTHLATGATCCVYDVGSRGSRWPAADGYSHGVKIPRAIWWGLEWAKYALAKTWRLEAETPILRGYTATRMFDEKLARVPKPLHKRLKYYRKFEPTAVDLRGIYFRPGTVHDGDDDFYRDALERWTKKTYYHRDDDDQDFYDDGTVVAEGASDDAAGASSDDDVLEGLRPAPGLVFPPDYVEYRAGDYAGLGRRMASP
eukprot:CAMPEP_0118909850 /NCGR_PEP_ID=MMETSP1166-20130328/12251_1 /TAXON_ID=1104430 /ORGANISM="Chrysoreinhardia sp, Strain CCMP3193" /LENGTH=279 /DNA_ID=CAMNT_0006849301 /DNA_START=84 /DNA_END=920 /DNA_ORIENTATION=-